jgi:hypothetical protein
MPFKSKAQEAYFFANKDRLEKQGVDVDEWANASKGMSLPSRVGKPKKVKGAPKPKKPMSLQLADAKRFHKTVKALQGEL